MDPDAKDEIGVLHARLEYLRVVISILLSRLSEDDQTLVGNEIRQHFRAHQDAALNSTFPDSSLRECEIYSRSQLADAIKRCTDRLASTPPASPKARP